MDGLIRDIVAPDAKQQIEDLLQKLNDGDTKAFDRVQDVAKKAHADLIENTLMKVLEYHKRFSWGFSLLGLFTKDDPEELLQIAPGEAKISEWKQHSDGILKNYVGWVIDEAETKRAKFEHLCRHFVAVINGARSSQQLCHALNVNRRLQGLPVSGNGRYKLHDGTLVTMMVGPPKSKGRAQEKGSAPWLSDKPEPKARYALTDLLRVTFIVANPYVMALLAAAIHSHSELTVVRQVNVHLEEVVDKPPTLQMNASMDGIVVEIMLMLQDFFEIKKVQHKYYDIIRASSPDSLKGYKFE